MRIVLQRVKSASVTVDGQIVGKIGPGLLLLVAVHINDARAEADYLAQKCAELRVFPDEQGKMNLSVQDTKGAVLVVSQFTLYGDCAKGRRPGYQDAARPEKARELYEYFVSAARSRGLEVQTGVFAASMEVELINDGPVTLILERNL
jgi:D-tyrosyl-tRNA(Tyr) deacylase